MRLTDFLRTAVLLFAGSATALAAVALFAAAGRGNRAVLLLAFGWWLVAAAVGLWIGRREGPSAGVARMMAAARPVTSLPTLEPGTTLWGRLWPLAAVTVIAGATALLLPQVPAVASGYGLLVAIGWRKQPLAVRAVEERDGVQFWVERSSPFGPTRLLRTPGLRRFTDGPG